MLATAIVAFCWRLAVPEILDSLMGWGVVYLVLVLALVPMVTVIGWFGAEMTFPIEKE